ncbi:MAG: trypsin-like peptidase domain-containing protein [Desulfuromonadales bacterium]
MGSDNIADSSESTIQHPEQKCSRNYKPWIWTLVVMALVTIVWALYEGSQQDGYVNNFLTKGQSAKVQGAPGPVQVAGNPYAIPAVQAPGAVGDIQSSYHGIIDTVRPAVISVDAAMKNTPTAANQAALTDPLPADISYNKIGSGVIIDPRGYVLSSYHVIAGAEALKATVYGPGGATEYPLKLVKADLHTDMALLRIQGNGPFAYAALGNSDAARTGDMVLTIGSPFGFEQTVTSGMISSRNRTLQVGDTVYENLIQTDSSINRGSSGGPMLNVRGEVIGINTAIFAPTGVFNGIGFAIPINRAAELVGGVIDFNNMTPGAAAGQLVAWTSQGRQVGNAFRLPNGQMITPPHGPRGACLDCHPQLFEQQAQGGVPANADPLLQQQNGLHIGAGRGLPANADPLLQQQNGLHIGAGAGRGKGLFGRTFGGPATATRPVNGAAQQVAYVEPLMGVGLVDVDEIISQQANMVHPEGVLVTGVIPGSPADNAGMLRGDILVRIAGRKILNIASLNKLLSSQNIGRKFELVYIRNGSRMTAKIKTGAKNQAQLIQQPGRQQAAAAYQWPLGASITPILPAFTTFTKTGVYVQNTGGVLAANGLRSGDIIKGINGIQVEDLESFVKQSKKVDSRKGFVLDVIRSGNSIYLTVKG